MTVELLKVAAGLAAFTGLYFAIAMLTDSTYRDEFLAGGDRRAPLGLRGPRRLPAAPGRSGSRGLRDSRPWRSARPSSSPGSHTSPATTAARPRCATCSPSTARRSPRSSRSGSAPGACFYYFASDDLSPTRFTNGRTGRLEESFLELTGAPLRLTTEPIRRRPGSSPAAIVDDGRPVLLITDLFHLDHYGNSAHFPGHAVVLAGYDDEHAYVSDTGFEGLQRTSLAGLAKARHEQHPFYPLAGHMVDVPGEPPTVEELLARRPGGDRAGGPADARAGPRRVRGAAGPAPLRRRGRLLARGDRRLEVVRPLQLPGDRAPRHRRRQLPRPLLALPRRGRPRGRGRRWPPRPPSLDGPRRRAASPPARPTSPTPPAGSGSATAANRVLADEERLWAGAQAPEPLGEDREDLRGDGIAVGPSPG